MVVTIHLLLFDWSLRTVMYHTEAKPIQIERIDHEPVPSLRSFSWYLSSLQRVNSYMYLLP